MDGLDFSKIGGLFLREYQKQESILALKIIFITLDNFAYNELNKFAHTSEQITQSLNHIYRSAQMDCMHCGFKEVCDEVKGLRKLHFANK